MSKNLVDNLPVFVEFNPTHKLLFVSCLLDQKKFFYEERKIRWLDQNNWEQRNQTGVLEIRGKKKQRKRKILCLCHVEVFLIAVDLIFVEWRY